MTINATEETGLLSGYSPKCEPMTMGEARCIVVPLTGVIACIIAQVFHSHSQAIQCLDGSYDYTPVKWICIINLSFLIVSSCVCLNFSSLLAGAKTESEINKFRILTTMTIVSMVTTAIWSSVLLPFSLHECPDGG